MALSGNEPVSAANLKAVLGGVSSVEVVGHVDTQAGFWAWDTGVDLTKCKAVLVAASKTTAMGAMTLLVPGMVESGYVTSAGSDTARISVVLDRSYISFGAQVVAFQAVCIK